MLLTHAQWAESNPAKQKLSAPHRSWRCVGISAESPIFFVDLLWGPDNPDQAIRSVMVASPEELIEIVTEVGAERCRVFYLGLANGRRNEPSSLTEVMGLRSHRVPGSPMKWYVYADAQGCQHSCFSWSPPADETSVWEEELVLNTRAP